MNTQDKLVQLNQIRRLSRLMDTAFRIPGTSFRIGWDPIIGLIPAAGDIIDTAISAYILFLAARFGLPRTTFGWMVFNITLEAVLGSVPLVGDVFDAFYKSNIRNLALLEQHLQATETELKELDPAALNLAPALDPVASKS